MFGNMNELIQRIKGTLAKFFATKPKLSRDRDKYYHLLK
jgi:hypothetical protein